MKLVCENRWKKCAREKKLCEMYEQKETTTGYIYYVNKQTGEPQNDNPKLLEIIKVIREHHKSIKFLAYRVATKIWFLKQSFYSEFSSNIFIDSFFSRKNNFISDISLQL